MIHCQAHSRVILLIIVVSSIFYAKCDYTNHSLPNEDVMTTIQVLKHSPLNLPYGENVTIICKTSLPLSSLWWTVNNNNLTEDNRYILEMESENVNEASGKKIEVSILHIVNVDLRHIGEYTCHAVNERDIDFHKITLNVTLLPNIKRITPTVRVKLHKHVKLHCLAEGFPIGEIFWLKDNKPHLKFKVNVIDELLQNSTLEINELNKKDNGTYMCVANVNGVTANKSSAVLVLDKPQVTIDFVKAIGKSKIFLNWTVNDGNEPDSLHYRISYKGQNETNWYYYQHEIGGYNRSYVLKDEFKSDTEYIIRIMACNSEGDSQYFTTDPVRTLIEDPVFIPTVKATGVTSNSITISWTSPPDDLRDFVHYYQLLSYAINFTDRREAVHLASKENLYMFSDLKAATQYDFQVAACNEYSHQCGPLSTKVNGTTMDGTSGPPGNVTVECKFDNISLTSFVFVTWTAPVNPHGIIISYNVNLEGNASFLNDQGIMEYTTWGPKVTSVNENIHFTRFYNVSSNTNYTVRISAVTRTKKNGEFKELYCRMPPTVPDKHKLSRFSWHKVVEEGKWMFKLLMHRISERNGPICCYRIYMVRMETQQKIAELPAPENLPIVSYQEAHRTPKGGVYVAEMFTSTSFHPEVFLGDDQVYNVSSSLCDECVGLRPYSLPRRQRSTDNKHEDLISPLPPYDGNLDMGSNYTGFIEIVIQGSDPDQGITAYSNYLVMMSPGPESVEAAASTGTMGLVVQLIAGFCGVVVLLLIAIFILHRHLCRSLRGRQRLVSLNPPDMCPILRSELTAAYVERHRDSDYGFQQEFELLPDRFIDRTTRASDARENVYKNRYPDIKAYDQTRVKLSQVDGVLGSDYINANYVLGYKERKKFICAQGPMDTTVNDFWRLIWEQHLELILMLTNLEEYSKTKCAKYWPDKDESSKTFGNITVSHIQETRYSDFIVRELRLSKESGGREEERIISQYHYLVWKDFMAPEYPYGLIKFIKRMNEAYTSDKGSILVHCSAGVGRTGTLVALDCLIQQMAEEGHVTIFNTVCELRHQRNFLVQSLKQYVFIYRAIMEVAQYGDTEIEGVDIKATVEKLRQKDSNGVVKLQEEFDNIKDIVEDTKCCSVGSSEDNIEKNRSSSVIPYDRNRVILTPLLGKEHSTYINASFIEGYDNSESFIITQDPVEATITDFWRMISEQGVNVVVMLSEIGDNKCPRYWPEDESFYDHIKVRYVQAESCPYYTRRELFVKNRDSEDLHVTHLQYHGWPTVDGEVPEVTRGLIELVDHVQWTLNEHGSSASVVVHCGLGAERSSLFVGLSILVQQLRVEHRVDIFTVTRKLRLQRHALINSYSQYEFLHRAIVNYAELHGLCDI
ncbi:tyrosine-protein phosphatase 69D [Photinus pyralis]|uniref:protein-tyrosine-phosphatase n=5 Tax=Photinus pyralis TaxID=7054 RepID=A0A1Y1NGW3_PHOPY|nr:tyrosine-protein phosphatase 69D [Photinus pyralis]